MSDFLERLNRRLRRKQAEDPIRGSDESEEAGAPEPPSSSAAPPLTAPAPEPAAASSLTVAEVLSGWVGVSAEALLEGFLAGQESLPDVPRQERLL